MKRHIPYLFLLAACSSNQQDRAENHILPEKRDTINISSVAEAEDVSVENDFLVQLLNNPIDLQNFKRKWGPSNSSVGGNTKLFDIPDTSGLIMRYFLFSKLKNALPSHPTETELFSNFTITTYKYGETVGDFYDTNEEILMVECALDNPELGELNWFGKSRVQLMDKYGSPHYEQSNCIIYVWENKAITAHFENNKVDWYKFVNLNRNIDLSEAVPGELLGY